MSEHSAIACAIYELAAAVRSHGTDFRPVTKNDLIELEESLTMKLDQIKAAVSAASKQNREAFQEIGTRIADLNQQIQDLQEAATNPDVTDEAFLADLQSLQTDAAALANIVPGSPTPGGGTTDGSAAPQP